MTTVENNCKHYSLINEFIEKNSQFLVPDIFRAFVGIRGNNGLIFLIGFP